MKEFIFNVIPAHGPNIPTWFPIFGGLPINSPLVGSFLGVFLAFVINWIWQTWNNKRLNFEEEYHIKGELSGIRHDLMLGGIPQPIEPVYGAGHVIKYRLFGENRNQVINWYGGFKKYNIQLQSLKEQRQAEFLGHDPNHNNIRLLADKIQINQNSMTNKIEGILKSGWLKRIPDDMNNSGLSRTKFIWYLLKQDALEEPTHKEDFRKAIADKLLKKVKGYKDRIRLTD